jgi:hypothetical protein
MWEQQSHVQPERNDRRYYRKYRANQWKQYRQHRQRPRGDSDDHYGGPCNILDGPGVVGISWY